MINIIGISTTLTELDTLYNSNPGQASYFSKLALLELCGWIEQTMDSILIDCANTKLIDPSNINFVTNNVIKRTYGFHYEDHFRPMLMKLIGLITLEKIETTLKTTGDLPLLTSQLGSLRANRDQAAHTAISGVTHSYDAPSRILGYLTRIHPILVKIETQIQSI
jgi:hypothetical protein